MKSVLSAVPVLILTLTVVAIQSASAAPEAFRRDPGHPQWHHGAFHEVRDSVRSDVRRMLHTRAEVPFQVPLEVNIVLIGFNNDGGYRYTVDAHKLEEFLRISFPSHRPSCLETGEPLDIEHHIVYNVFPAGQPELIALEKALKEAMVPAGTARESDYGREVPLFEVDATAVESVFQKLYSYIFDMDNSGYNAAEMDRPVPSAIFIVNFDKRNTIYARVDSALHRIRDTSEYVQTFAAEYLKTPLSEPVKGKKNKSSTELWLEKFYKKKTNLPEPLPHELVERLEKFLDNLEEELVDLSSLLYDHRLQDAHLNSSEILQSTIYTQQYVDYVLVSEKEKMKCCDIEYRFPVESSQTFIYGGILLAGFFVYFLAIFFSSPVR